jgi:hypothetical protein
MKKMFIFGALALGLAALAAPKVMACDGSCKKPKTSEPAPAPAPKEDA